MRRASHPLVGLVLACLTAAPPALADPALDSLVPLIEVYGPGGASPGFDVAGIRCGGLYAAQEDWASRHRGIRGPSAAERQDIEDHLTRAEIHRREQGLSVTAAYETTLTDVQRVIGLYQDRFAANAQAGGHPWTNDPLLAGDAAYCAILGGRR